MRKLVKIEYVNEFPIYDITVENDHCFELENGIIAHNSKAVVSGGCLEKDINIQMGDGTLKAIDKIEIGDFVKTLIGNKQVTHTWNPITLENGTPECYKVTFENDYSVICSDKHQFLINDKWQFVEDLFLNDKNKLPKEIFNIEKVGKKEVYDISVADAEHYILENGIVSHNTGSYYSANEIFIIGRQQEKDGSDLSGYNFIINVEKSRLVKEKSKIPITVKFEGGLSKYSGLLDIGLETGFIQKPSNGYYSRVDDDGVVEDKKWRAKATECKEFWDVLLKSEKFKEAVKKMFKVSSNNLIQDDDGLVSDIDIDEVDTLE